MPLEIIIFGSGIKSFFPVICFPVCFFSNAHLFCNKGTILIDWGLVIKKHLWVF